MEIKAAPDKRKWFEKIEWSINGRRVRTSTSEDDWAFNQITQDLNLPKEHLLASLENTLAMHDYEVERRQSWLGWIEGLLTVSPEPGWVKVDGQRLMQLTQLVKSKPRIHLSISNQYLVRDEDLREALQSASTQRGRQTIWGRS